MPGETYRSAGVDRESLAPLKRRIAQYAASTHGPEVLGGAGFFGGLFQVNERQVLVASTDGVGTKAKVAARLRRYEGLGVDLVNLNIGDILACGASPLFFLDYIAAPADDPLMLEELVRGMVRACREAGCALLGGETAQMPDTYQPGAFDLAGFVVGVVDADSVIDGSAVLPGDILLGVASSGVHTNGFSLVRRALRLDEKPERLNQFFPRLGSTLADALLVPHRGYWPLLEPLLPLAKGVAHVTGGGLPENLARVLPKGLAARVDGQSWTTPPVFQMVQEEGGVPRDEMLSVFNMGVGMVVIVSPDHVDEARRRLPEAWPLGQALEGTPDGPVVTIMP